MELQDKSREELFGIAKKLELKPAKNIDTEDLRSKVELAAIERHVRIEEEVREKQKAKSELKRRVAEVKASADLLKITIEIPDEPTILDVVRLEKKFGIKKKIPKPSPETVAIEASKKVYAIFRNLVQDDVDIRTNPGGKYWFHFWPGKVHVLPEWLIKYYRSNKNTAGTRPFTQYKETQSHEKIAARMTRTELRQRFAFETIGDAPEDAKFGVVTDNTILSKLEQLVA